MALPFKAPLEPMLAKLSAEIPSGDNWLYEPKWDGFRALVFRDGDKVWLQSRDLKPLNRYFPELEAPLLAALPDRCVLDGEIVIANDGVLDFDALLGRIHPAASRVAMLAKESPSSFVAWDILALGDEDLRTTPQGKRREILERELGHVKPPVHVTPMTRDPKTAADWFERFEGAGLDGVMAKPLDAAYQPGKRAMMKIKHARTADCVVAGFRWYKDSKGELVGSLLLGLYDDEKVLHHVGICASFKRDFRARLAKELEPLREGAKEGHPWARWAEWQDEQAKAQRRPGATSRWNRGKDLSWEPIRIELVAEVGYDHMQGTRFRHATHFKRWRPDKPPSDCRYDQLETSAPFELAQIFGGTKEKKVRLAPKGMEGLGEAGEASDE
ncbi:MAG: ATP-dependent DNA ligase [Deltaproteobacteria bacterium]|nr:ATP-dependent DNA ligase [Deltaproteobacteria bacterium]